MKPFKEAIDIVKALRSSGSARDLKMVSRVGKDVFPDAAKWKLSTTQVKGNRSEAVIF